MRVRFFVSGIPAPKGSARAFFVKKLGRSVITNANAKTKPWEQAVREQASSAQCLFQPTQAVEVLVEFIFPRPGGHFGKNGLKPSAPAHHTQKPDGDKCLRCVLDALTGIAYADDKQVVSWPGKKRYANAGEAPGAWVEVGPA